jgi:hypothetical protein
MANSKRSSPPRQFAYILRVWETRSVPPDPLARWSASIEDVRSGQTIGFPNLEGLMAFLRDLRGGCRAELRIQNSPIDQENHGG